MATRLSNATRSAITDATAARFDAGAGAATIEIRTGSQPATAETAATGTLLATLTFADPAWAAASNGVAALDATPVISGTGVAAGTAGWFRVKDSNGNTVIDGAVGSELTLDNAVIAIGQTVNITSGTMTTPATT